MKIKLVPPYSKSLSIHNEVLSGFSTCCPDEQNPAGWALWCPEWDRWCPHPGDNKKRREAERKETTNLKKEQKHAAPADVTRIWVIASTWLWHHSKNIWREAGEEKKMEKVSVKNRKRQIRKEADDYRRKRGNKVHQIKKSNDSSEQHRPTGLPLCTAGGGNHTHTSTDGRSRLQRITWQQRISTDTLNMWIGVTGKWVMMMYRTVPGQLTPARPRWPAGLPACPGDSSLTSSSSSFLTERGRDKRGESRTTKQDHFIFISTLLKNHFKSFTKLPKQQLKLKTGNKKKDKLDFIS